MSAFDAILRAAAREADLGGGFAGALARRDPLRPMQAWPSDGGVFAKAGAQAARGQRAVTGVGAQSAAEAGTKGALDPAAWPTDPKEWRALLGSHPWINSPSRAQFTIMMSARHPDGRFMYTADEISDVTGYLGGAASKTQSVLANKARHEGIPIPKRGQLADPTAKPGGARMYAVLDAAEALLRGEGGLGARGGIDIAAVAERAGTTPTAVKSMLAFARRGQSSRGTPLPEEVVRRARALPRATSMVRPQRRKGEAARASLGAGLLGGGAFGALDRYARAAAMRRIGGGAFDAIERMRRGNVVQRGGVFAPGSGRTTGDATGRFTISERPQELPVNEGDWDTVAASDIASSMLKRHGPDGAMERMALIKSERGFAKREDRGAWLAVERELQRRVSDARAAERRQGLRAVDDASLSRAPDDGSALLAALGLGAGGGAFGALDRHALEGGFA